jgi:tetratricopeptide (TPR) repeat protein
LYHYVFKVKVRWERFLPLVGMIGIYIVLRLTLLKNIIAEMPQPSSFLQRLPGVFVAIANYLRLLVLPLDLHMEYGQRVFSPLDPQVFAGMAAVLMAAYLLRRYRLNKAVVFFVAWFFVSLIPVSNIFPLNAYMAEHWLYLPSIGFFCLLAEGRRALDRRKSLRTMALVGLIGLLAFYAYLTVRQNTFWKDPEAFYKRTLRYAPDSYRANHNLGLVYHKMGKYDDAIVLYQKAMEIKPDSAIIHNHLGLAYFAVGRTAEATEAFRKALVRDLTFAPTYYNLGNVYYAAGRKEEAIPMFAMAIKYRPDSVAAYNNLGIVYADLGRQEMAIFAYEKALAIDPQHADTYNNLGAVYDDMGQTGEAVDLFKKTIVQYPSAIAYFDKARDLGYTIPGFEDVLRPYREKR